MVKYSPANAEDAFSMPQSERSPGVGNGNPLQYSCQESPMDRGAWQATVHGVGKSQTQLSDRLSTHTHTHTQHSKQDDPGVEIDTKINGTV